jgi:hypothetical protein
MSDSADDPFEMLYCDSSPTCRVNTFERCDGSDNRHGINGRCPGCGRPGEVVG